MLRPLTIQAVTTPKAFHSQNDPQKKPAQKPSEPISPPLLKRPVHTVPKRATTREIFETLSHESERAEGNPHGLKNYSLKYVLHHKPTDIYFKVDRSQYPQVITYEQAAQQVQKGNKNPHAGRVVFVDGFHQVLHSAAVLKSKEGKVLVRLKGPVVWPIELGEVDPDAPQDSEKNATEKPLSQASSEGLSKPDPRAYQPWQIALKRLQLSRYAANQNKPIEMDIIVEFTSLLPDGYTEDLTVFPTEELPKLWSQKRLNLSA